MNVYILTYHRPFNYGAVLQAFATQEAMSQYCSDTKIVDYRDRRIENDRRFFQKSQLGIFQNFKNIARTLIYAPKEMHRRKNFTDFCNKNFKLTSQVNNIDEIEEVCLDASVLVSGSDLVWNWELNGTPSNVFLLDFSKNSNLKRISYASSIGTESIPDQFHFIYSKCLSVFDKISVREETTGKVLQSIVDKEISVVLDPVLLFDSKFWKKYIKNVKLPEKYICVYDVEINQEFINFVSFVANKMNLPIVHFGLRARYNCSKEYPMYDCGPSEFLGILANSECVITNSFHGVAFSLIFKKKLYCIPHTTRGIRMTDLLNKLEMSSCIINTTSFDESMICVDNSVSYEMLEKHRKESWAYLKLALYGEK